MRDAMFLNNENLNLDSYILFKLEFKFDQTLASFLMHDLKTLIFYNVDVFLRCFILSHIVIL